MRSQSARAAGIQESIQARACPCGQPKQAGTLFCDECVLALSVEERQALAGAIFAEGSATAFVVAYDMAVQTLVAKGRLTGHSTLEAAYEQREGRPEDSLETAYSRAIRNRETVAANTDPEDFAE